eukprot:m.66957 g.66957  ORF g.66957 m.66957 type:complete len:698 (-) comp15959_c1_seq1:82-2175(-)
MSFLSYNSGGDSNDVWPFAVQRSFFQYDCSKLDQWNIVLTHAQSKGIHLNFKTQETENDNTGRDALDQGEVGPQRRVYYRELVARFGHFGALTWNLGEENTQTFQQQRSMAEAFHNLDPYDHNIVIHSYPRDQDEVYRPLLGANSLLTGASIQAMQENVHADTLRWIEASAAAGRAWVVANDEQGHHSHGIPPDDEWLGYSGEGPTRTTLRRNVLWGNLLAGGSGVEAYFGYANPHNDLNLEDFRSREMWWDACWHARDFLERYVPFWDLAAADSVLRLGPSVVGHAFGRANRTYVVYLSNVLHQSSLDLTASATTTFEIAWYDPRNGGGLLTGTVPTVTGGSTAELGVPPTQRQHDWVALLTTAMDPGPTAPPSPSPSNQPTATPTLMPSAAPTAMPSTPAPTAPPTDISGTAAPTVPPTDKPTAQPSPAPTVTPTTMAPSSFPTIAPSEAPSDTPSMPPTHAPTMQPTSRPTAPPASVSFVEILRRGCCRTASGGQGSADFVEDLTQAECQDECALSATCFGYEWHAWDLLCELHLSADDFAKTSPRSTCYCFQKITPPPTATAPITNAPTFTPTTLPNMVPSGVSTETETTPTDVGDDIVTTTQLAETSVKPFSFQELFPRGCCRTATRGGGTSTDLEGIASQAECETECSTADFCLGYEYNPWRSYCELHLSADDFARTGGRSDCICVQKIYT